VRRIAVFGAGAIGTWLGAALAVAAHDVVLFARGAHGAAMARDGVRLRPVDGPEENVDVTVAADTRAVGPVDAVLLTVKAHDSAAAAPAIAPLLGPATTVVTAQNGVPWWYFDGHGGGDRRVRAVDPDGTLRAGVAPERILGAVVYLGAAVIAPGVVATQPQAGLVLGEPDGTMSARLAEVAGALEGAGFPVRRTDDIRAEIWTKLMGNSSLNLLSVLTQATTGRMATDPGVAPLVRRIMDEVAAVGTAAGAPPRMTAAERLAITAAVGEHQTSTLQDLHAGRRLELDALGAAVLELAEAYGVPTPTLRDVYALADLHARSRGVR
jgi:2-dehydropantoate 2-reductase